LIFSLKFLPLEDDELVMSEMQKKWGVTDFVLERTGPEEHPNSEKIDLCQRIKRVSVSPEILQLEL